MVADWPARIVAEPVTVAVGVAGIVTTALPEAAAEQRVTVS